MDGYFVSTSKWAFYPGDRCNVSKHWVEPTNVVKLCHIHMKLKYVCKGSHRGYIMISTQIRMFS